MAGEIERRDNVGPVRKVSEVGMTNTVHGDVVVRRREVRAVAEGKTDISCSWVLNPTPQFSFQEAQTALFTSKIYLRYLFLWECRLPFCNSWHALDN
jgi:hypothetical protein